MSRVFFNGLFKLPHPEVSVGADGRHHLAQTGFAAAVRLAVSPGVIIRPVKAYPAVGKELDAIAVFYQAHLLPACGSGLDRNRTGADAIKVVILNLAKDI